MYSIFEEMRRANADWYTASPLETLGEEELADLARQAGMTLDALRRHLATPHIEMTCPLCGRPQTHLIGCKGCGGGAWGREFEAAHGAGAADQLRQHLRTLLARADGFSQNKVQHAANHAYVWDGCMLCVDCWHNTLPYDAYLTCPLNLVSERRLHPLHLPQGLLLRVAHLETRPEREGAIRQWLEETWRRWTEIWNTVPEGPERRAVAEWRGALFHAAFVDEPPRGKEGNMTWIATCVCGHEEEEHAGGYGSCTVESCLCAGYEPEGEIEDGWSEDVDDTAGAEIDEDEQA